MPVDQVADLVAVTHNFVLSTGSASVEQAECTIWTLSDTNPSSDGDWNTSLLEQAEAFYDGWAHNVAGEHWENSVAFANVTCRHEATNGHTLHEQVFIPEEPWVGTGTGGSLPWQTSLVLSLYSYNRNTFIPNQRRRRGRIYLPPMGVSVLNDAHDGLLAESFVGDRMGEIGTGFTAGENATYTAPGAYKPLVGVNSRGPFKDLSADPDFFRLVELSIDTKLDTQRRRTKSLIPIIGVLPYPVT